MAKGPLTITAGLGGEGSELLADTVPHLPECSTIREDVEAELADEDGES
jgi:hypothetical protein